VKLYVSGLPWDFSPSDLDELFSLRDTVTATQIIYEKDSGRSRGFGFVELADKRDALQCINALNSTLVGGRMITVALARPKERRTAA
jgi:RNA recognition motif-containing protein